VRNMLLGGDSATAEPLPEAARAKLRLRPREGGVGVSAPEGLAAAAYVGATVDAAPLIFALCPDLRPLLDVTKLATVGFLDTEPDATCAYVDGVRDAVQRLPEPAHELLDGIVATPPPPPLGGDGDGGGNNGNGEQQHTPPPPPLPPPSGASHDGGSGGGGGAHLQPPSPLPPHPSPPPSSQPLPQLPPPLPPLPPPPPPPLLLPPRKERLYATPGLLRPNQEVFIVCVELYGGIAVESWDQLRDWAKEFAPPPGPGRHRMVSALLTAWRLELSLGLLEARVGSMFAAQARLRAAALVEEGVGEEQQRQRLRVYDLCSRRSVLFDYAQRAREARSFRRVISVI